MKKFLLSLLIAAPMLFLARAPEAADLPYDEAASPAAELPAALEKARVSGKRVLIVFGANWCPDCRVLDHELHAPGDVSKLIDKRYVVLKVDVGHFDKNLDFTRLYGEPIAKGIPSVVVVTPKNEVVYETRAGELAEARQMGDSAIYQFFENVADKPGGY
jgi:thioredoxin 1